MAPRSAHRKLADHSLLAMGRNRESQVFRFRQLPLHLKNRGDVAPFLALIASVLGTANNIRVFSLAQETSNTKTATVSFRTIPSIFDNDEQQWTLQTETFCGQNIIVDTHFQGFTVLSEPQQHPHTVEWVVSQHLKALEFTDNA